MARRGFLKALGAAPVGAQMAAQDLSYRMAGVGKIGGALGNIMSAGPLAGASSQVTFQNFASWFREFGAVAIRRESREVTSLDADIVTMHLPLATKVRMQRERNYQWLLENKRDWFGRELKNHGKVDWWP